jgi:hypothetical protein
MGEAVWVYSTYTMPEAVGDTKLDAPFLRELSADVRAYSGSTRERGDKKREVCVVVEFEPWPGVDPAAKLLGRIFGADGPVEVECSCDNDGSVSREQRIGTMKARVEGWGGTRFNGRVYGDNRFNADSWDAAEEYVKRYKLAPVYVALCVCTGIANGCRVPLPAGWREAGPGDVRLDLGLDRAGSTLVFGNPDGAQSTPLFGNGATG